MQNEDPQAVGPQSDEKMSEAARAGTVLGGLVGHRQGDRGEAKRGRNGDADSGKKGERCLDAGLGRQAAPPWRKPECKLVVVRG
jgi:hypothetical protein